MPKEFAKIVAVVGAVIRNRLRQTKLEPLPERLTDLLSQLSGGPSSGEQRKDEAPRK